MSNGNERQKLLIGVIEDEMKTAYVDYAMSVIVGRALPDARDGLKPVHRRILYAMQDMGMRWNSSFKKCARIVGEVLGKYHPHGDTAVYDSLVRMAQDFSLRYPLIDGQGNFGCFTKDTKVKLTDGRSLSFGELINEHKQGKKNYTYTVSSKGKIEISEIKNPRLTIKNAEIMKVILDNGEEIKCTLNHKFMIRNGEYKEAQELKPEESLMPIYTRLSAKEDDLKPEIVGYPLIFQPNLNTWELAHHLADGYNIERGIYSKSLGRVRHHKDFNKLNNNPENIQRMNWKEHWKLHSELTRERHKNDAEYIRKLAEGRKVFWTNKKNREAYSKRISERNRKNWQTQEYREKMRRTLSRVNKEHIRKNPHVKEIMSKRATMTLKRLWQDPAYRKLMKEKIIKGNKNHTTNKTGKKKFLRICKEVLEKEKTLNPYLYENYRSEVYPYGGAPKWETGFGKYYYENGTEDLLADVCKNHKVDRIEFLNQREDVYDLTIENTHNFALAAGVFVHNSIDGDRPAAMRYTEARMKKISDEMLQDIEKNTVAFMDNFDGSLKEPAVLPSKLPNLLVNGSSGIAVGMATNIPPHNASEVCNAAIHMLDNPECDFTELMEHLKGPDFPTGGIIAGRNGIHQAYKTGRGRIKLKSNMSVEENKNGRKLIIDQIPYMVNKSLLIEQIALAVKDKKVQGISDLRDESDRNGMRIVLELYKNANPEVVQNMLLKHTRLSTTFGIIFIALVDNQPKVLTLKDLLEQHLIHRKNVVVRRTKFDLKKAEERAHILEGLLVCLKNVDVVVKLIRAAKTVEEARKKLVSKFKLTPIQANAILDMRLQKLASMEQQKVKNEYSDLQKKIARFKEILGSAEEVKKIIKSELKEIIEKYGDERLTQISEVEDEDLEIEDLIEKEDVVVTITNTGYVKRIPLTTYRAQHRGGKGIIGTTTKEDDFVENLFVANTHSYLLAFTNKGRVHWIKVFKLPQGSRTSKGTPIVNLLHLQTEETVQAIIPIKEFEEGKYLITATKNGIVKKTSLSQYSRPRRGGIIALTMDEDDELVNVRLTDGKQQVMLATQNGMAVRFKETDARPMGRSARGVIGVRLGKDDGVVDMVVAEDDKKLLTITENGFGKKTPVSDYRLINRGGKGVINIKTTERNGKVVSVKSVTDEEDIIIISKTGIIIRTKASEISTIGRNTQGVRLMRMKKQGDKVVSAATVVDEGKD